MKNNGHRPTPKCLYLNRLGVCFALLAFAVGTGAASHELGYLPLLGPAPFRFIPVIAPSTNKIVLPKSAPLPEPEPVAVQMARAKAQMYGPPAPAPQQLVGMMILPTNAPQPVLDPTSPDAVISPQMLLRYFSRSSNGTTSSVVAPVEFSPPRPANPSSSATYSTGP